MEVAEALTQSTLSNVYDGLVTFDSEMRVVPALAVSWSSPDERTWLFRLRPGVRLHDGQLLTARDVTRALERARSDPESRLRGRLATIAVVEPADLATVRIVTTRPDPMLLNRLAYVLVVPRPRNGTGPYRIAAWSAGQPLELQAFDEYWGGRPSIDRVRFVSIPDPEQRLKALRDGSVDVLRWVPEARLADVARLPAFRVSSRAGLVGYYLWFDSRPGAGPFADARVRRAASLAIDRAQLVAELGGHAEALEQLVPVGVFGHMAALPKPRCDPEAARRLLAQAGYPNGLDVVLTSSPGASMATVRVLVSAMLRRVGIRTRVVVPGWSEMMADLEAGRLPFYILGWRLETGEASSFLHDCLHTPSPAASSGNCNPGYSNPVLDRLLDASDQILDDSLRLEHYQEMMALVGDELPVVPLYRQADYYAVSTRLGFTPRLDGKLLADDMTLAATP